ncbi:MAG: hypothetical protein Kow0075_11720 [Salibacteraceae bacterium]
MRIFKYLLAGAAIVTIAMATTPAGYDPPKNSRQGIVFFEGSWEEALAEAKKQNKPIFLDAYASWCGPCKLMKARVFTNPEVGAFFNEHFVNYEMNMEKGIGPKVARNYGVTAYPTLFFLDPDGKILKRAVGYHHPEQLIEVGKLALSRHSGS